MDVRCFSLILYPQCTPRPPQQGSSNTRKSAKRGKNADPGAFFETEMGFFIPHVFGEDVVFSGSNGLGKGVPSKVGYVWE